MVLAVVVATLIGDGCAINNKYLFVHCTYYFATARLCTGTIPDSNDGLHTVLLIYSNHCSTFFHVLL